MCYTPQYYFTKLRSWGKISQYYALCREILFKRPASVLASMSLRDLQLGAKPGTER